MKNGAFFVFAASSESFVVFEIIAFEILNLLQALRCNTQTFLNFLQKNRFLYRFLKFSSNEHCSNFLWINETNKMTPKLSNLKIFLGY